MVDDAEMKNYLEAARVANSVRETAQELVKPGASLLELARAVESEIRGDGAKPAFPVNISVNDAAAHYTPKTGDLAVFSEKDLVKIDYGVHAKGFIIDAAFTVDLSGENGKLVEAAEAALSDATSVIKAGVNAREVGAVIEKTISSRGFKPIENLCGHSLGEFLLHAGKEIPNVARGDYVLREGDVFAVEPFATTGAGRVEDGSYCEIYSLINVRNVRLPQSRKVLEWLVDECETLPFAKRWLDEKFSEATSSLALADLRRQEIVRDYPILKEINKGLVAQAECTLVVEKDSCRVLG
ncbi:MAG: type II methionyl aminopeptidase [Candidatus Micrarchaeota archaeon]